MPAPTDELSPLQRETLERLSRGAEPVIFDPGLVADVVTDADRGLGELAARLCADDDTRTLAVNKYAISLVLACEAAWAEPAPFAWTSLLARGTICHRAIQLGLNWRGPAVPAELVDSAIDLLVDEDRSIGLWLATLTPAETADVRGLCVERVAGFLECFPPLQRSWIPVTEGASSYPAAGAITLRAKPDLTLGVAAGGESRKVIIDLKSGRLRISHRDDLRFYALVETLTRRTPPRLLVSYSLESCAPDAEAVTIAHLRSAVRRTLDAIERMVEIRAEDRPPTGCERTYCPTCRPAPTGGDHVGRDDVLADEWPLDAVPTG